MPTNRPSEDRYGSAFQEQASKEAIQKYNREKNKDHLGKKSVIEKLTAPPETLKQHAEREGFTVDEHYWVRTDTASETTWEERLRISRPSSEPAQVINVPDEWEIR